MATQKQEIQELKDELVNLKTEDLKSVKDFWAKHNFGTRLSLVTFMVSFLAIVVAGFFGVTTPDVIVNLVGNSALIAFMTVTLGVNGIEALLNGVAKIKLIGK